MAQTHSYTSTAKVFHWLLALLILGSLGVGWYMTGLPVGVQRLKLINWHKWAGIAILTLSALRLLWRLTHPAPPLPDSMPAWQKTASHASHFALYVLFFATPLIGWAYSSAAGFPVVWFGVLPLPDWVPRDRALADAIKPFHAYAAYSLATVVGVHVLAALKHHFVDRDVVLRRMLPRATAR